LVALGSLLVTIGTIVTSIGLSERNNEIAAMKGEILPFEIDCSKPFEVWIGSNQWVLSGEDLDTGIDLNSFVDVGAEYPIRISFKDNRLFVSAEIKNADNVTTAKIVDNQWVVNQDLMLVRDRNYNAHAFEVIDSNLLPILQVNVTAKNTVRIGCIFYAPTGRVFVTPKGLFINPAPENISEIISPIFKYPSETNLGAMVDSANYVEFFSLSSTRTIVAGGTMLTLGSIMIAILAINELFSGKIKEKTAKDDRKRKCDGKSRRGKRYWEICKS
jgi:hypothetical protein